MPVEALIIVDAQRAFVSGVDAVPASGTLVPALDELLHRARAARALVVHLQNDGPIGELDEPHQDGWELFFPVQESEREVVIREAKDDGFDGTPLAEVLAGHEIKRLAIGGVMSEMCVGATARAALERGFGVVMPHDGHVTYTITAAPDISDEVPPEMVARVAEWALGDEVEIVPRTTDVSFIKPNR